MLCYELNSKILQIAPRHIAKSIAPSSFEELSRLLGTLVVYSEGSDQTIYGDNKVNHAFRAWHDYTHLRLNAPFTLEGETLVAKSQANHLGGYYGEIIMIEVIKQVEYFETHGHFPVNQTEFVLNHLKGKL